MSRRPPDINHFRNPGFSGPTPHTVEQPDADGYRRTMGHLGLWETAHVGMPGQNVRPPRSPSDYAHFHVATEEVTGDDGEPTRVPCGHLTCDTGHASLDKNAHDAARFYDNTGTLAASVCMGEDDWGIWYSGIVEPELPELTLRRFSSCSQSGDWRDVHGNGQLDLVASLSVVTPGFPIPRARVASAGTPGVLIAAGALLPRDVDPADIRIVISTSTPPEEATPMTQPETETPEPVTAAAPPFAKDEPAPGPQLAEDSLVQLTADPPPGVVRSIDGDTAVVEIEVPVSSLAAAEDGAKQAMAASAQRRMERREYERDRAATAGQIEGLSNQVETLVASLRHRDDQAAFEKAPAGLTSAEGN